MDTRDCIDDPSAKHYNHHLVPEDVATPSQETGERKCRIGRVLTNVGDIIPFTSGHSFVSYEATWNGAWKLAMTAQAHFEAHAHVMHFYLHAFTDKISINGMHFNGPARFVKCPSGACVEFGFDRFVVFYATNVPWFEPVYSSDDGIADSELAPFYGFVPQEPRTRSREDKSIFRALHAASSAEEGALSEIPSEALKQLIWETDRTSRLVKSQYWLEHVPISLYPDDDVSIQQQRYSGEEGASFGSGDISTQYPLVDENHERHLRHQHGDAYMDGMAEEAESALRGAAAAAAFDEADNDFGAGVSPPRSDSEQDDTDDGEFKGHGKFVAWIATPMRCAPFLRTITMDGLVEFTFTATGSLYARPITNEPISAALTQTTIPFMGTTPPGTLVRNCPSPRTALLVGHQYVVSCGKQSYFVITYSGRIGGPKIQSHGAQLPSATLRTLSCMLDLEPKAAARARDPKHINVPMTPSASWYPSDNVPVAWACARYSNTTGVVRRDMVDDKDETTKTLLADHERALDIKTFSPQNVYIVMGSAPLRQPRPSTPGAISKEVLLHVKRDWERSFELDLRNEPDITGITVQEDELLIAVTGCDNPTSDTWICLLAWAGALLAVIPLYCHFPMSRSVYKECFSKAGPYACLLKIHEILFSVNVDADESSVRAALAPVFACCTTDDSEDIGHFRWFYGLYLMLLRLSNAPVRKLYPPSAWDILSSGFEDLYHRYMFWYGSKNAMIESSARRTPSRTQEFSVIQKTTVVRRGGTSVTVERIRLDLFSPHKLARAYLTMIMTDVCTGEACHVMLEGSVPEMKPVTLDRLRTVLRYSFDATGIEPLEELRIVDTPPLLTSPKRSKNTKRQRSPSPSPPPTPTPGCSSSMPPVEDDIAPVPAPTPKRARRGA